MTTLVNAENQFFTALKDADFDVTKVDTSALSSFNSPQVMQAIEQIDSYLVTTCGINPSDDPELTPASRAQATRCSLPDLHRVACVQPPASSASRSAAACSVSRRLGNAKRIVRRPCSCAKSG